MKSLAKRIMEYAEATPICPSALLHLGKRGAMNQALWRLARSGQLLRICRGVYMRPIETRFGRCAPSVDKLLRSLSAASSGDRNGLGGDLRWVSSIRVLVEAGR